MPAEGDATLHPIGEGTAKVQPERRTAVELMLIVAHHGAAAVGREVVLGVAVTERERRVGALVRAEPHAAAHHLVPVLIVQGIHAVAREA